MTRLGRGILGVLLILAGIWHGLGSHSVNYQSGPTGTAQVFVSGDGTDYLRFPDNPALYMVKAVDFTPYPNPALVSDLRSIGVLIYKSNVQQIEETQDDGTKFVAFAYTVERFSFKDTSGEDQGTYTSSEYAQHPVDYYDNYWPIGAALIGMGTFFLLLATLIPYWVDKLVWREKSGKSLQI